MRRWWIRCRIRRSDYYNHKREEKGGYHKTLTSWRVNLDCERKVSSIWTWESWFFWDQSCDWMNGSQTAGMPTRRLNRSDGWHPTNTPTKQIGYSNVEEVPSNNSKDTTIRNQFVGSKEANCERKSRCIQMWQGTRGGRGGTWRWNVSVGSPVTLKNKLNSSCLTLLIAKSRIWRWLEGEAGSREHLCLFRSV